MTRRSLPLCLAWLAALILSAHGADDLVENFARPPASARPWVYWFWNNANVTREGITADLEAMQRVGLGGVILMDVVENYAPPRGSATFMSPEWKALFQHAVTEASRLGLEINLTNAAGWTGSSGPWITPELSMRRLVSSDTEVEGPVKFDGQLPQPVVDINEGRQKDYDKVQERLVLDSADFRDVAVLAFPSREDGTLVPEDVRDLTAQVTGDGHLVWDVPPGKWTLHRIGHVTTGETTRPPVAGGVGLEVDKFSVAAMDVHFDAFIGQLATAAGALTGKTFTATHIDSWEVRNQNWTPKMREEFQRRRGYDPIPYLPCLTGQVRERVNGKATNRSRWNIGGKAIADRFRWDFAQTCSELLAENYVGRLAARAHERGLRLSIEGYNLPFADEALYSSAADEPMSEFWTPIPSHFGEPETKAKGRQMASLAHVYGHPIVGAEAFTSDQTEAWRFSPRELKPWGDFQFAEGINRFVIHRFAHQPYLDRAPGSTMGPWGLHYERTNTWWELSKPWHEYLARCQWMLRQGLHVADLLYLRPQLPNQRYFTPEPAPPAGYRYDECSAEALLARASVREGRIVLPDGMSYRMLVLPPKNRAITPVLMKKITELARAGAAIYGPPPTASPSLSGYPQCDDEVATLARQTWADCDGQKVTQAAFGAGQVFWGAPLAEVLGKLGTGPDLACAEPVAWIHRRVGDEEIYFVANLQATAVQASATFRARGAPERWNPETGETVGIADAVTKDGVVTLTLSLGPTESAFVMFRPRGAAKAPVPRQTAAVLDLTGPWAVAFDPKWGGPPSAEFSTLESWSARAEEGIRHYSGSATYRRAFDFTPATGRQFLDLGDVQVAAQVTLNGRDCGIAWKPPYRVEITAALQPGANQLEIRVANLWPNRLIGDAALPENQRLTWTTWQPFAADAPLLPSGLLGPVQILSSSPSHVP